MAPAAVYDRLTALDESFLHLERPETPMHVGAVAVLERAPFYDADGRFRLDEVRALVASRLQLIPRFRKRVMAVPLGQGRPVWVDHDGFDIADHVRLTALPAPGNPAAAARARRAPHGAGARPRPTAVGALVRRGVDRGEHVGLDPQVAPHAHRRHLRRRHRDRAARLRAPSRPCSTADGWMAVARARSRPGSLLDTVRERMTRPAEMVEHGARRYRRAA